MNLENYWKQLGYPGRILDFSICLSCMNLLFYTFLFLYAYGNELVIPFKEPLLGDKESIAEGHYTILRTGIKMSSVPSHSSITAKTHLMVHFSCYLLISQLRGLRPYLLFIDVCIWQAFHQRRGNCGLYSITSLSNRSSYTKDVDCTTGLD